MMCYYPIFDVLWWLSEVYFCHLNSLSIALAFSDIYIETSKKDAMSLAWYMNHNIFEMLKISKPLCLVKSILYAKLQF